MHGVSHYAQLLESQLDVSIDAAAFLQYGLDINEAREELGDERADHLCGASMVVRGFATRELLSKFRSMPKNY